MGFKSLIRELFTKKQETCADTEKQKVLDVLIPITPISTTKNMQSIHNPDQKLLGASVQRSKTITARNLLRLSITVPEEVASENVRYLFGDYFYNAENLTPENAHKSIGRHMKRDQTHKLLSQDVELKYSAKSLKELQTNVLKGVRWTFNPKDRTIVIEGRQEKKLYEAAEVFRERIYLRMRAMHL